MQCISGRPEFLSTPSARRATSNSNLREHSIQFLSTPSARRATANIGEQAILNKISIHALREEGDVAKTFSGLFEQQFLSTPSARRAT